MATCALFGRNLLNELIAYIILPERRREEERKYISDPDSGAISLSMGRQGKHLQGRFPSSINSIFASKYYKFSLPWEVIQDKDQGAHIVSQTTDNVSLVHPKERLYFRISLAITLLVYLLLIITVIGLIYIAVAACISLLLRGLYVGNIRANGIRVSDKQFPEVYRIASDLAAKMEIHPVPAIYVLQAGGVLNALATKLVGVNYVIIYSDVLELAYDQGEDELAFVICHELAHIKRRHVVWHMLFAPAMLLMASSYSRACEYTCDRYGAHYCPDGAIGGLIVLAAGKKLYRRVNAFELGNQVNTEKGFWVSMAETHASHPTLPKRLTALGLELPSLPAQNSRRSS